MKEAKFNDILISKTYEDNFFCETWIKLNGHVYYRLGAGYKDKDGKWINRSIVVLERDVTKFFGLFRLAVIAPKKSYASFLRLPLDFKTADKLSAGGGINGSKT